MASAGGRFSHLHSLHVRLKDVQDQLAKGPRQIRIRQNRIAETEQSLVLMEQALKAAKATVDSKNLDLKSKEAHLVDLQGKLNTASSNREYDIITGQIQADRVAKAVLEDEILEWLDRVDADQEKIAATKKQIQELQVDTQNFASEFEAKSVELQSQQAALKQRISEVESIIPNELMTQYRRLVDAYGSEAMAPAENGICGQCRVTLTTQNRVVVNSGKLLICSVCGRLLYPVEND